MKTKHIIAVGLLSALAVGLLAFGISKTKHKPKTLSTQAYCSINSYTNQLNYTFTGQVNDEKQIINGTWQPYYTYNITQQNTNLDVFINVRSIYLNGNWYTPTTVNQTTQHINLSNGKLLNMVKIQAYTITYAQASQIYKITFLTSWRYQGELTYYTAANFVINLTVSGNPTLNQGLTPTIEYINIQQQIDKLRTEKTTSYNQGYQTGHTNGYNSGYGMGYNESEAFNHPIDFAPMMLNILTMPFTFISQAFDVTLWPGTQYQINIGNFIKAMIAISAILFIIRLFTSGFSIIGNYTSNINREARIRSDNRKSKQAWKSQKIAEKGAKEANKQ